MRPGEGVAVMPTAELRKFEKVCEILDRHGKQPAKLIPSSKKSKKNTVTCPKR
jgi:hypothetical protein